MRYEISPNDMKYNDIYTCIRTCYVKQKREGKPLPPPMPGPGGVACRLSYLSPITMACRPSHSGTAGSRFSASALLLVRVLPPGRAILAHARARRRHD